MAEAVTCRRTLPSPPAAKARRSSASRAARSSSARPCRAKASPAGVGRTPRAARSSRSTPQSASRAWMRLAAAEVAMPQRSAARVTLPSSRAARKILRVVQSGGAAIPSSLWPRPERWIAAPRRGLDQPSVRLTRTHPPRSSASPPRLADASSDPENRAEETMGSTSEMPRVTVREVGPRDGLQMAKTIMPTKAKLRWITAMVAAGVPEMEVASFVPPAAMPQMADAAEVTRAVRATHPGLRVVALAPNLRGAQNAAAAGAQSIIMPVSASEAHSQANVRRSRADQVAEVARVVAWAKTLGPAAPRIEAGISTAFGCSLQGEVPEWEVVTLAAQLTEAGADIVALADTLGYAGPSQVRRLVRAVRAEVGAERFGNLHLHDTLGTALANVLAALAEGVRGFDAALGGLGGCPFAPGSVGNAATEDLVYLLESEGFTGGIDLPALVKARGVLRPARPEERLHGRVAAAGVPRPYRSAAAAA